MAADIPLIGHDKERLRALAIEAGFTGLGLARTFLHLDTRERPAVWYYPGSFDLWQT